MRCETTADPQIFWKRASGFLLGDPVANNVIITNVADRRSRKVTDVAPATYLIALDGAGVVVGAAMRTPPRGIYVSRMPPGAVAAVVEALVVACPDAPGVSGTAAEAEAAATEWRRRTGAAVAVRMRQRMHRLEAVSLPASPPGHWRPAGPHDRGLLVEWSEAFQVEAWSTSSGSVEPDVDLRLAEGRAFLWVDGEPVSYVGNAPAMAGVVRIGPVYTPPRRRRRGYASALVAAVTAHALAPGGASACMLYTDLANSTANRIYAALGYRPVGDVLTYGFE